MVAPMMKNNIRAARAVLPITHYALAIIAGHFLDVEKSEN